MKELNISLLQVAKRTKINVLNAWRCLELEYNTVLIFYVNKLIND